MFSCPRCGNPAKTQQVTGGVVGYCHTCNEYFSIKVTCPNCGRLARNVPVTGGVMGYCHACNEYFAVDKHPEEKPSIAVSPNVETPPRYGFNMRRLIIPIIIFVIIITMVFVYYLNPQYSGGGIQVPSTEEIPADDSNAPSTTIPFEELLEELFEEPTPEEILSLPIGEPMAVPVGENVSVPGEAVEIPEE